MYSFPREFSQNIFSGKIRGKKKQCEVILLREKVLQISYNEANQFLIQTIK